jgi:isopentenyl diphosphate isomerase/L-lactate dehydrogenase-like FMN-dependent dehydrogenase
MTTDTSTLTDVVDTYIDMWNEEDADRRAELIRRAWTDDARYRDPLLEADGHAGLDEMVATVQSHYPGHRFRRTTGIDAHHDLARFGWELVAPDGVVFVAGVDVAALTGDGRLRTVSGFFADPPARED